MAPESTPTPPAPQGAEGEEKAGMATTGNEMITNRFVIGIFRTLIGSPSAILLFVVVEFLFYVVLVNSQYVELKNRPFNTHITTSRLHDVVKVLDEDFGGSNSGKSSPDGIVIWCDSCEPSSKPDFAPAINAVTEQLRLAKATVPSCADMDWVKAMPGSSGPMSELLNSKDGMATVVLADRHELLDITQQSECIIALRKALREDMGGKHGDLHVAFGTPLATVMASSAYDDQSILVHLAISLPILAIIFWMYVGSVAKAVCPLIVVLISVTGTRATLCVIKLIFLPDLNFGGSDLVPMFIQIALSLDYAVIFWGRLKHERAEHPGLEAGEACLMTTLQTAGLVIAVSVAVLVVAYCGILLYPDLNEGPLATALMLIVSTILVGSHALVVPTALSARFPSVFSEPAAADKGPTAAQRFFRWWGSIATRPPWTFVLPLVVYGGMLFFLHILMYQKPNYNVIPNMITPHVPEYAAYQVYQDKFTSSRTSGIIVVLQARPLGGEAGAAVALWQDNATRQGRGAAPGAAAWHPMGHAAGSHQGSLASPSGPVAALAPVLAQDIAAVQGGASAASPGGQELAAAFVQVGARDIGKRHPGLSVTGSRSALFKAPGPTTPATLPLSLTPQFRAAFCRVAEHIVNATNGTEYRVRRSDIEGTWWDTRAGKCRTLPLIDPEKASKDGLKLIMTVYPGAADPMGYAMQDLTRRFWNEIEPSMRSTFVVDGQSFEFTATQASTIATVMASNQHMSSKAPRVMTVTVVGICVVVGLFFRSAGVAIKVLLSVVLPISANYGLLVGIFQFGWLEWLGLQASGGVLSSLQYITFGFLLGLAIDYDVVLFARVYERRLEGYDNESAVRIGLFETGPMITLAGTLMSLSFLTIIFTDLGMIKQLGTLYFMGVAIDTYIVRTCIAPTMLCLAGQLNYWPKQMPTPTKSWPPKE